MKIIIITRDTTAGIGVTVKNLVWNLEQRADIEKIAVIAPQTFKVKTTKVHFYIAKAPGRYFITKVPIFAVHAGLVLRKVMQEDRYDVIHTHSNVLILNRHYQSTHFMSSFQLSHKALASLNIPLVSTFHFSHKGTSLVSHFSSIQFKIAMLTHRLYAWFDSLTVRNSDVVTCVSNYTMKELEKDGAKKFIYLPNGVDVKSYHPIKIDKVKFWKEHYNIDIENKKVIFYLGRLDPAKGIYESAKVLENIDNIILIIAGDGSEKEKLEKINNIKLIGFVSSEELKNQMLNCADVFIYPSLYENFPLAICEAMAAGLPVLATKVGMVPTLLDNREPALYTAADQIAFRQKLLALLKNEKLRENEVKANLKMVETHLNLEDVNQQYYNYYKQLIKDE